MSSSNEIPPDHFLEPVTRQFVDQQADRPHYLELAPADARAAFSRLQSLPTGKPSTDIEDTTFPVGPTGSVPVRIIRPRDVVGRLPILIYCHGGGWIAGDFHTHDRLTRELAVGANAALVVVGFQLAPEARYPIAVEQVHAASVYVATFASELNLDASRLAIAGDSTGGTIAATVAYIARERRTPRFDLQVLICPATDPELGSYSHQSFASGPWLTRAAIEQAWHAYLPDAADPQDATAVPLRASPEQLANLPDALVIVAENDVTRDEGESYARNLSDAGVRVTSVRFNGTIHDFVVLNALADTPAARDAISLIISALNTTFR